MSCTFTTSAGAMVNVLSSGTVGPVSDSSHAVIVPTNTASAIQFHISPVPPETLDAGLVPMAHPCQSSPGRAA